MAPSQGSSDSFGSVCRIYRTCRSTVTFRDVSAPISAPLKTIGGGESSQLRATPDNWLWQDRTSKLQQNTSKNRNWKATFWPEQPSGFYISYLPAWDSTLPLHVYLQTGVEHFHFSPVKASVFESCTSAAALSTACSNIWLLKAAGRAVNNTAIVHSYSANKQLDIFLKKALNCTLPALLGF